MKVPIALSASCGRLHRRPAGADTFMSAGNMKTLPVGLSDFVGEMGGVDWGATFATITLSMLPTLIVYAVLNKQVIEGMTAGAIKS